MMNTDHTILVTAKKDFNKIKIFQQILIFNLKLFKTKQKDMLCIFTYLDVLAIIVKVSIYIIFINKMSFPEIFN